MATITMADTDITTLTASGTDAKGQPSGDTWTWTCSPPELLSFQEGGTQTATGPTVHLRAATIGTGSVVLVGSGGATATDDVIVHSGAAVSVNITVG